MINAESKIKILNKLEERLNINNLSYLGINIWPLVRLHIAKVSSEKPLNKNKTKQKKNYLKLIKLFLINLFNFNNHIDILFYSRLEDNYKNNKNIFYDKNLDFVNQKFKTENKITEKFALLENEFSIVPNYENITFINMFSISPLIYLKFKIRLKIKKDIKILFNHLKMINKYLDEKYIIDLNSFYNDINIIYFYSKIFEKLLNKKKPKLVFMSCYYNLIGLSLILAGRNKSIPTVDVQHGLCEPVHIMYTHWNNIPKNGFNLLPNFFMSWGEPTAKHINSYFKNSPHRALVAGKPDLLAFNRLNFIEDSIKKIESKKLNYKKTILFTCSLRCIPDNFYEVILEFANSKDFLFLIRYHPLHSYSYDMSLIQDLRNRQINNIDIESTNKANLYNLLSIADFHITGDSTVAYEALYFDLRTIVLEKEGKIFFEDYVKKNIFIYETESKKLISLLNNNINFKIGKFDKNEYYITKKNIVLSRLFNLN